MPLRAAQRWSFLQYAESLQSASVTAVHWVPFQVQSPYFLQPSVALHVSAGAAATGVAAGFPAVVLATAGVLEELSLELPPQQPDRRSAVTDERTMNALRIDPR